MATAATAASTAPFVVGRPDPDPPLPYPAGDLRPPGLARRAKTALGVGMTVNHVVSSSTPAAVAAVTRNRDAVTSRGGPWPRLVVRDASGRTLDTFTTLQDAIYRASWTVKALHEWPVTPLQWRLPKAPVPSRPDFSRAATRAGVTSYSLDLTRSYRNQLHSAPVSTHPVLEIDVDDVAFVAESLRLLPELPSFAFLRHSLLAGERTYLNIVGSLLLHQRHLAWTDKRQADYTFPGFCTGCRRAGFCYGCDKNPKPHVHEDIPMRMGGGFQYYRRDRPLNQHLHRDPRNWATGDADIDLRNIVERCGGLALYERAAMASQGVMEAGGVTSQLPFLPSFSRVRLLAGPWPGQKNFFIALRDPDKENEEEEDEDDEKEDTVDFKRRPDTIATERPWRKSALKKDSSVSGTSGVDSDDRKRSQSLRRSVTIDTGMARVHGEEASEEEEEEEEGERAGEKKEEEEDTGRDTEYDSGFEGGGTASHRHRPTRRMGTSSRPSTFSPTRSVTFTRSRSRSGARSRSRSKSPGGVAFGGSLSRSRSSAQSVVSRDTAESAESRKARLENIPFAKKRGDVLYKAPSVFRPVKRGRRITVARDPFSRDRQYNIPQGGAFQLKKGGAKTTKFVNIKRGDAGWKPPKKFELKHNERQATQFWSRSNKDKGKGRRGRGGDEDDDDEARRRRRRMADSEDSGLDSDLRSASTRGKDTGLAEKNENETDDDAAKETGTDVTGDGSDEAETAEKKKRKEVLKKARRVISPPGAKLRQRSPTPPPPPREPTPEPTPPPTPPPPTPPYEEPPLPDISLPEIPDLPEWKEAQKAEKQKKQKFLVAPPPVVKEAPKRRKPPPRVRKPLKLPLQRLKTKPAEAPVSSDQVHDMQDPLDWLAKYCIINPDRLPLYEMVFEYVVAEQKPRYTKPPSPSLKDVLKEAKADNEAEEEGEEKKKKKGKKKREKPEKEEKTINEFALLHRSLLEPKVGLSLPEQQLEKLCYTLDTLHQKLEELGFELQTLEDKRTKQVASKARELFPEVAAPDYVPKVKKKGKKSKSKPTTPAVKLRAEDITDDIIMARLDDKMLSVLRHEPDVRQTELEMERAREKIRDVTERLQELATEKLLTDAFCMNHYFARQGVNNKPRDFRRQQSELYNRLHPDPDFEMNFEEVEEALQQINGHLLTDKEFFFLYNVLNLPARTSLNFRLFSVVAALSEKVTQLDPVIRKLINNTDLNALDIKMEKCRELFMFLEDGDAAPRGGATADKLAVELTAGGLTPEHTRFVLTKFNREMRGVVDFLDFVTYVPLFILIHRRIISHPLREELDL